MSSIDINKVLPIATVDPTLPRARWSFVGYCWTILLVKLEITLVLSITLISFCYCARTLMKKFDKMKHQLKTAEPEPKTTKSKFKYKGKSNKIQGRFNEEMLEKVTQTKTLLESGAMKRPCRLLEEVVESLHKRIKLIKIADKSPAGWEMVKQYESGSIASDSEDERKIRAAEKRAIATRKASHTRPTKTTRHVQDIPNIPPNHGSSHNNIRAIYHLPPLITRNFRTAKPTDICLGCGLRGHWKKDCPTTRNTGKDLTIRYVTLCWYKGAYSYRWRFNAHARKRDDWQNTYSQRKIKNKSSFMGEYFAGTFQNTDHYQGRISRTLFSVFLPRHHSKTTYPHTKIKRLWAGRLNNC